MSTCPHPRGSRAMLIVGDEIPLHDTPLVFDVDPVDPNEETHLLGDTGPLLVVQCAFCSPKIGVPHDQRNCLFQSTCTIRGKICKFIIDSGACENVIFVVVVCKLSLVSTPHPHPYTLGWLSRDITMNVTNRVQVPFSIDSNSDIAWCDVVSMDACHLLLGRPWQHDRRVIHDGFLNTYLSLWMVLSLFCILYANRRSHLPLIL